MCLHFIQGGDQRGGMSKFKSLIDKYKSMIAGKEPLAATFWLWGVLGMIIVLMLPLLILLLLYLALFGEPTLLFSLFINLLWLAYGLTVVVGIWRSANAYQGSRIFPNAAKLFVAIGLLFWIQQLYYEMPELYNKEEAKSLARVKKEAFDETLVDAKHGIATAQNNLGVMYAKGDGVPKNVSEAIRWWHLAANLGELNAQNNPGNKYENDREVPLNDTEAAHWWRLAADKGQESARFNLGIAYYFSWGVPGNAVESAKWLRLAAEQGLADAQARLGAMYERGSGMPQNLTKAANWYQLAAEQSYPLAQYNLGSMYANGQGVPKNYIQSYMWINLAAVNGLKKALESKEILRGVMTPEQIAEAEALTQEWLEEHK